MNKEKQSIMEAYNAMIKEEQSPVAINQFVALDILKKMVKSKVLSAAAARFLDIGTSGRIRFGGESSAQGSIFDPNEDYLTHKTEWPNPADYWYKEYDSEKSDWLVEPKKMMKHMKKSMITALRIANKQGRIDDLEFINEILEQGADVQKFNKKLDGDDRRGFRMLDRSMNDRDIEDLTYKTWK
jgi:hypothetical protein